MGSVSQGQRQKRGRKIRASENADCEITGVGEGRRRFFYVTQSSTLPNDPSLFRAAPAPPPSTSMSWESRRTATGNSFLKIEAAPIAPFPLVSARLHESRTMGDVNFEDPERRIGKSILRDVEEPDFLRYIYKIYRLLKELWKPFTRCLLCLYTYWYIKLFEVPFI